MPGAGKRWRLSALNGAWVGAVESWSSSTGTSMERKNREAACGFRRNPFHTYRLSIATALQANPAPEMPDMSQRMRVLKIGSCKSHRFVMNIRLILRGMTATLKWSGGGRCEIALPGAGLTCRDLNCLRGCTESASSKTPGRKMEADILTNTDSNNLLALSQYSRKEKTTAR